MVVRSQWEKSVENHIRSKYPNLPIRTNDRTVIPSRTTKNNLEIDIFLPSIRLGIELNGEKYHNHSQYVQDKEAGTTNSDEAYKEKYCEGQGIFLLNIWSSQSEEDVLEEIDFYISKRINDPSIEPYIDHAQTLSSMVNTLPEWVKNVFYVVAFPVWGFAALAFLAAFSRSIIDGNSSYDLYISFSPLMIGAFVLAVVYAFGSYCKNSFRNKKPISNFAIALLIVFGLASASCLYTVISEREPFTGYYSAEYYKENTPLNKVSVGKLWVENDLPYLSIGGYDGYENIQTAIAELGYKGDPLTIYNEALNTSEETLQSYEPPRSLWDVAKSTDRVYGFASFSGNGRDYTLLVTTYKTDEGKKYRAYIYEDRG